MTRELRLFPVEKTVPPLLALNADTVMGGAIVPLVLLPRLMVKVWRAAPVRLSLKLIWLAEFTAAVVVIARLPRLTLIGPVRPVLFPPRVSVPGPVFVRPTVEARAELIVKPKNVL